jgi:hypothetical protein
MPLPMLDFIASLEQDLTKFYERLKTITLLQGGAGLFSYMAAESERHSRVIDKASHKYHKPEVNQKFLREIHEKIKNALFDELSAAQSVPESYDKLAKTEEQLGKLYSTIADYCKNMATYYTCIADEITEISKEELTHRDMILENKKTIPDDTAS